MDIILTIIFFLLGIFIYIILDNNCLKKGHCGTCLEDLKNVPKIVKNLMNVK